jgi:hypothetical protein
MKEKKKIESTCVDLHTRNYPKAFSATLATQQTTPKGRNRRGAFVE